MISKSQQSSTTKARFDRDHPPVNALIQIEAEHVEFQQDQVLPTDKLIQLVVDSLWFGATAQRFVVCYGAMPLIRWLAKAGVEAATLHVISLRKRLCYAVFSELVRREPLVFNPLGFDLRPIEYEIDGLNINPNFMGTGLDFFSTKRLHFDILEPLGSNLYLPTSNICGGWPVFADLRAYCWDHKLRPTDIIEKIPGTRNFTIGAPHYSVVLEQYTVAFDVDTTEDAPFTLMVNLIEQAAVMHGGTDVTIVNQAKPASRVLRHYAFDATTDEDLLLWYNSLGYAPTRAPGDPAAQKRLIIDGSDTPSPLVLKSGRRQEPIGSSRSGYNR